jgi:biotin carboxyl carrier protein
VEFEATVRGRVCAVAVGGADGRYTVTVDGRRHEVDWRDHGSTFATLLLDGTSVEVGLARRREGYTVVLDDVSLDVDLARPGGTSASGRHGPAGAARLSAPMPGRIVRVLAAVGDEVTAGQPVVVVEAMKMENEIRSPRPGRVLSLDVREGEAVDAGALLAVVE